MSSDETLRRSQEYRAVDERRLDGLAADFEKQRRWMTRAREYLQALIAPIEDFAEFERTREAARRFLAS